MRMRVRIDPPAAVDQQIQEAFIGFQMVAVISAGIHVAMIQLT